MRIFYAVQIIADTLLLFFVPSICVHSEANTMCVCVQARLGGGGGGGVSVGVMRGHHRTLGPHLKKYSASRTGVLAQLPPSGMPRNTHRLRPCWQQDCQYKLQSVCASSRQT
jgi:hypothetical protein